ncbi:MAG: hypothetical protein WD794_09015 [Mycobacteriales bacterium]
MLAYALAWQHDRELVLVLSDQHAREVARRLPWVDTPVTVRTLTGEPFTLSRSEVLTTSAALEQRTVEPFVLDNRRAAWVERLLADPGLDGLEAHGRANYLSWHHRGLQVLRLSQTRSGLRVQAGVQYSRPQPGHKVVNVVLKGPMTDTELSEILEAVAASVSAGGSLTTRQTEHRLQASIGMSPPAALGLPFLAREYPAYRGPGRPGFIDFLGCDGAGRLHVVETKVGHDPKVVLQALDYGIWLQANETGVRSHRPDWPRPDGMQKEIYLDFVLSAGDQRTAVNGYLPGQLEALAPEVNWRVFVVADLDVHPVALRQIPAEALWRAEPGVTSASVRPPRGRPAA